MAIQWGALASFFVMSESTYASCRPCSVHIQRRSQLSHRVPFESLQAAQHNRFPSPLSDRCKSRRVLSRLLHGSCRERLACVSLRQFQIGDRCLSFSNTVANLEWRFANSTSRPAIAFYSTLARIRFVRSSKSPNFPRVLPWHSTNCGGEEHAATS
jgi:hypothetical protein